MKDIKKKKRITEKDFRLLLTFLTDGNEATLSLVKDQIKSMVKKNPRFRDIIPEFPDPNVRNAAIQFTEELRFEELTPAFERLFKKGENMDLERGAFLLASIEYPQLKLKDIQNPLDQMAEDIDRMMDKEEALPTKAVHGMRRYLFEKMKFKGNEDNYYDPANVYINKVIETKVGMPISLSCIYLFVAWRLKFPVHGIGLPGHFIVGHRVPRGVVHIDPFNGGRVLRTKDCEVLVKRLGMPFKQEYLDPMPNLPIFSRMIVNLINVYNDRGHTTRAQLLAQLFQLIQ